ncbi:hypothetical protein [Stutzerimonas stutzeri]|uniref:hypothetical protein n=1 Tax=Stutzerimonas stutzeri TaxID=316 RepID=UPI001F045E57
MAFSATGEARVAVLVDCDNVTPEILEHALRVIAQFGRVVLRRGYGNHGTLANRWQEALVRLAFTPCLQYQYAAGKNIFVGQATFGARSGDSTAGSGPGAGRVHSKNSSLAFLSASGPNPRSNRPGRRPSGARASLSMPSPLWWRAPTKGR